VHQLLIVSVREIELKQAKVILAPEVRYEKISVSNYRKWVIRDI
jgi:hypothetical protein